MTSGPPTWIFILLGFIVVCGMFLVCAWNELKRCFQARCARCKVRRTNTLDPQTPLLHQQHQHSDAQLDSASFPRNDHHAISVNQPAPRKSALKTSSTSSISSHEHRVRFNHLDCIDEDCGDIHQPPHHHHHPQPPQPTDKHGRTKEEQQQHQKRLAARLNEVYANSSVVGESTYQSTYESTIDHNSVQLFHEMQGEPELSFDGSIAGSQSSGAFSEGDLPSSDDDDFEPSPSIKPEHHQIAFDTTSTLLETMSCVNSEIGYLSDGDVDLAAEVVGYEDDDDDGEDRQHLQPTNPESMHEHKLQRNRALIQQRQREHQQLHGPGSADSPGRPLSMAVGAPGVRAVDFAVSTDNENIIPIPMTSSTSNKPTQHHIERRPNEMHKYSYMDDGLSLHHSQSSIINNQVVSGQGSIGYANFTPKQRQVGIQHAKLAAAAVQQQQQQQQQGHKPKKDDYGAYMGFAGYSADDNMFGDDVSTHYSGSQNE